MQELGTVTWRGRGYSKTPPNTESLCKASKVRKGSLVDVVITLLEGRVGENLAALVGEASVRNKQMATDQGKKKWVAVRQR